jgi:hypothetical protein
LTGYAGYIALLSPVPIVTALIALGEWEALPAGTN